MNHLLSSHKIGIAAAALGFAGMLASSRAQASIPYDGGDGDYDDDGYDYAEHDDDDGYDDDDDDDDGYCGDDYGHHHHGPEIEELWVDSDGHGHVDAWVKARGGHADLWVEAEAYVVEHCINGGGKVVRPHSNEFYMTYYGHDYLDGYYSAHSRTHLDLYPEYDLSYCPPGLRSVQYVQFNFAAAWLDGDGYNSDHLYCDAYHWSDSLHCRDYDYGHDHDYGYCGGH